MSNLRYYCSYGHELENRLNTGVNTGLRCFECAKYYKCQSCGWQDRVEDKYTIRWVGSYELAEITGRKYNPKDGGVYGICSKCKISTVVLARKTWWLTAGDLERAGGYSNEHLRKAILKYLENHPDEHLDTVDVCLHFRVRVDLTANALGDLAQENKVVRVRYSPLQYCWRLI